MTMTMPMSVLSELPTGFRFHPTDEELVVNYLQTRAAGQPCPVPIVADVDIYKYDPWHLPAMAVFGDREWYFFSPRDRKYPNGLRPNRSAASGFWKATGTDKLISLHDGVVQLPVAVKKALVFYVGRPPTGTKTPWIMHEYRLLHHDDQSLVLCRIFSKTGPPSPAPESDLLQDLLPASVIQSSAGLQLQDDYYCTGDVDYSDMYSGVLLAIQEELPAQVMYQCECHHHKEGEAISEITGGDGEGQVISEADTMATTAATHHQEADSNGVISDSEQQIDSMFMDQAAFFANQHK